MMKANESPLRTEPVLRTRGLDKEYGRGEGLVHALDGVALEVSTGETLAVMGPSGCGKSTLLHLLGGLERPSGGEVWLGGRRIDELSEKALARIRRHAIGFVFQAFHLMDELTALENVELPALLAGRSPHAARDRAGATISRRRCRAGSASASRSPARSATSRSSSSPTSRPATSTVPPRWTCSASSTVFARPARRW